MKNFCKPTTERFVCDFSSQFNFFQHFYVEFTQPATCVSHTVLRSVSILNGSGEPPEKFAKYLARQEYKLEIEFADKEESSYKVAAKQVKKQLCYSALNPRTLNPGTIVVDYKKVTRPTVVCSGPDRSTMRITLSSAPQIATQIWYFLFPFHVQQPVVTKPDTPEKEYEDFPEERPDQDSDSDSDE